MLFSIGSFFLGVAAMAGLNFAYDREGEREWLMNIFVGFTSLLVGCVLIFIHLYC